MFQSWIAEFKKAMSNTITEYMLLAMAVVPFLVALGLATAACVIWLAEALGTIAALFVVAAGFAVLGLATMVFAKSYEEPDTSTASETEAQAGTTQSSLLDGGAGAFVGLLAAHPQLAFSMLRVTLRNLPALVLGAIMGALMFSDARRRPAGTTTVTETTTEPIVASGAHVRARPVVNGHYDGERHRPVA